MLVVGRRYRKTNLELRDEDCLESLGLPARFASEATKNAPGVRILQGSFRSAY
jgi:hypothetical protein